MPRLIKDSLSILKKRENSELPWGDYSGVNLIINGALLDLRCSPENFDDFLERLEFTLNLSDEERCLEELKFLNDFEAAPQDIYRLVHCVLERENEAINNTSRNLSTRLIEKELQNYIPEQSIPWAIQKLEGNGIPRFASGSHKSVRED